MFMCRDPGDTTSKVSCCVQTSYCFKNRDFENTVNLKSASFVVIMFLHEGLTRIHLHCSKGFALSMEIQLLCNTELTADWNGARLRVVWPVSLHVPPEMSRLMSNFTFFYHKAFSRSVMWRKRRNFSRHILITEPTPGGLTLLILQVEKKKWNETLPCVKPETKITNAVLFLVVLKWQCNKKEQVTQMLSSVAKWRRQKHNIISKYNSVSKYVNEVWKRDKKEGRDLMHSWV